MSSGENIEIGIGADSSGLIEALEKVAANLKSLEKVLAGVSGSFESAGKAAEDAMGDAEEAADKAGDAVEGLGDKVEESGNAWDDVADKAGRADSALSGISAVIEHVNPEMAKLIRLSADVAGGMEQVILAIRQAPVLVAVIGGAVLVFEQATKSFREEAERYEQANQALSDSYDRLIGLISRGRQLQDSYTDSLNESLGVTNQITERFQERISLDEKILSNALRQARVNRQIAMDEARNSAAQLRRFAMAGVAASESGRVMRQASEQLAEATSDANQEYEEALRVAREVSDANILLAETERDLAEAIEDRGRQVERTRIGMSLFSSDLAFLTDASMGMTRHITNEATGAFVMLEDGMRMSTRQARQVGEAFADTNRIFGQGSAAVASQADLVERLNELLGHEDERYSAITRTVDGVVEAHGAVNMVTLDAIDVGELYTEVMRLQRDAAIEEGEALEDLEVEIDKTKTAYDAKSVVLKELIADQREYLLLLKEQIQDEESAFGSDGIQRIDQYRDRIAEIRIEAERLGLSLDDAMVVRAEATALEGLEKDLEGINDSLREGADLAPDFWTEVLESAVQTEENLQLISMRVAAREEEDLLKRQQLMREADIYSQQVQEDRIDRLNEMERIIAEHHQEVSDMEEQAAQDRADRIQSVFEENIDGISALSGALSDVFEEKADALGEDNMAQAEEAFRISKALASAEIIANTAAAVMSVVARAKTLPGAIAQVAAVSALGAVQLARANKAELSFHSGGIVPESDPSETSATLLPGEAVLNRSATSSIGPLGIAAMNAGMLSPFGMMMAPLRIVETYKHFDRFVGDEYRRQGTLFNLFRKNSEGTFGQRGY
jgi:uncharacterized protein with GYD domain